MRACLAIARREIAAFFHSAIAPVVLSGFLLLVGLFFTLFAYAYSELSLAALKNGRAVPTLNLTEGVFQPLISDMTVFLLFLLPAITMRLFSEEYRSGRYDLIMSYPVADHVWVGGKFLATVGVAGIMIFAAGVYCGIAALLGHPEPGPLAAAAVGLLLFATTLAAWGIFFSTLFQHQVVSYILTFAFAFLLFAIGGLEPYVPAAWGRMVTELSLAQHFQRFSRGVLDSRDVVYFAGWTLLGLFAATASLAGRRRGGGQRLRRWLPCGLLAALLVLFYLIALRHPLASDWTRNRRYSLAPQTEQVLAAVLQDVRITAFYQRLDPNRPAAEVLLRACRDRSPRIRYRFVDPDRELSQVEQYGVKETRSVVVEIDGRRTLLLQPDESALVNAIYRLATGAQPVIYFLQGQGEHRLDSEERGGYSNLRELLAAQGYQVRSLFLREDQAIAADADIVVVAAPKLELTARRSEILRQFVRDGGSVLALLDPGTPASFAEWMATYNVKLGNDLIISLAGGQRDFGVDARVVVLEDTYGDHAVTRGLPGLPTIFPHVQSLAPSRVNAPGIDGTVILRTGRRAWAERDPETMFSGQPRYEEGVDLPGPIEFGVALEVERGADASARPADAGPRADAAPPADDPVLRAVQSWGAQSAPKRPASILTRSETSRLVVLGDSEFVANANLHLYRNRDLILNICSWLARESELIALRARPTRIEPVVLTERQKDILGFGAILGWPLLVGAVSTVSVLRRRRHH